ncbi:MAG: UDP-N-acetylglucosamine 2-epimerase (non-hydrolyzing) [Rickettsiales bacterium]|jgi:UDP-N-acetylglucosamine 2-epimerase (non-hydrolysing)
MKNILIIFGTRPEIIKLSPVILEFKKHKKDFKITVCNTEQQKDLSIQTLKFFDIAPDLNLDVMEFDQSLIGLQTKITNHLNIIGKNNAFDAVIVQGDTMSAFCGALFGFLNRIPVFHVEAGLRSYNLNEPFPEEGLRQMISRVAALNFVPTKVDFSALGKESVSRKSIIQTGNTVIDALFCLPKKELDNAKKYFSDQRIKIDDKLVLITAHRRENHGERLDDIIKAIIILSGNFPDHNFVIPTHPNPNVKGKIYSSLSSIKNIFLEDPLSYPNLVFLMKEAKLIITDSGGIQEEAPSFGCPVLVIRHETERTDGIKLKIAKLIGTDVVRIVRESTKILKLEKKASRIKVKKNPYGDGKASQKIVASIKKFFKQK